MSSIPSYGWTQESWTSLVRKNTNPKRYKSFDKKNLWEIRSEDCHMLTQTRTHLCCIEGDLHAGHQLQSPHNWYWLTILVLFLDLLTKALTLLWLHQHHLLHLLDPCVRVELRVEIVYTISYDPNMCKLFSSVGSKLNAVKSNLWG